MFIDFSDVYIQRDKTHGWRESTSGKAANILDRFTLFLRRCLSGTQFFMNTKFLRNLDPRPQWPCLFFMYMPGRKNSRMTSFKLKLRQFDQHFAIADNESHFLDGSTLAGTKIVINLLFLRNSIHIRRLFPAIKQSKASPWSSSSRRTGTSRLLYHYMNFRREVKRSRKCI